MSRTRPRGFELKEVSADKAYTSATNFTAVEAVGGTFFPAFKKKTVARGGGSFEKAYHWFCLKSEEYLQHYHRRSNVESAFSMLKRKYGAAVKAKTWRAMVNETYAKVVCHNISVLIASMYELGIDPKLAGVTTCTITVNAAQQLSHN